MTHLILFTCCRVFINCWLCIHAWFIYGACWEKYKVLRTSTSNLQSLSTTMYLYMVGQLMSGRSLADLNQLHLNIPCPRKIQAPLFQYMINDFCLRRLSNPITQIINDQYRTLLWSVILCSHKFLGLHPSTKLTS